MQNVEVIYDDEPGFDDFEPQSNTNQNLQTMKRQEDERRKAQLRQKFEQGQQKAQQRQLTADQNDDAWLDEVVDSVQNTQIGARSPRSPRKVETYMNTKGFLANAPGFSTSLDRVQFEDHDPDDFPPQPSVQEIAQPVEPQPTPTKSGLYKPVSSPGSTQYQPDDDLPSQYQSSSVHKWLCPSCNMENSASSTKCGMCGNNKAALVTTISYETSPSGPWQCPRCKVENKVDATQCSMCGTRWEPTKIVTAPQKAAAKAGGPAKRSPGGKQKKKIVGKNESGVELEYAKKVDVYVYKTGSTARPGHGASY